MSQQLESALVIALRDTIKWESAGTGADLSYTADSGTLTPVNPSLPFDAKVYQAHDRQLAYRDLIVGAAIVEVSVQVGDVWNYSTIKPKLQGPTPFSLPFAEAEAGELNSQIRHVTNVSIPYDAARYADADLYGRDSLAYEILARACASTFLEPSIPRIDDAGTVITNTSVWSLAEGSANQADINDSLPLNRDLFKNPDVNLADRDNQLAGYVSQLAQVLKNPFGNALRIYTQIEAYGTIQREPDIYTMVFYDGTNRVFQTEPALPGGNRITYNTQAKTLQWTRERVDEIHVPQIYAMSIPGIEVGQFIQTLAEIPERKDAQYWRSKAGQLQPTGIKVTDTDAEMLSTVNDSTTGGYMQYDTASLTVPGRIAFNLSGTVGSEDFRVSILAKPSGHVEIAGAQNTSDTSGTLGGATFEIDVASGDIGDKEYLVEDGDGIVYNSVHVLPGNTFFGLPAVPTYTQYGASPSTVRQHAINFQLALPQAAWNVTLEYTNISGVTNGFDVKAQYAANGADTITIIQDTSTLPFDATNGTVLTTPVAGLDVPTPDPFNLPIYWTAGAGQLHIRKLIFEAQNVESGRFAMTGTFAGSLAYIDVNGLNDVPDVLRWQFSATNTQSGTFPFTIDYTADPTLPIQLRQVQVQSVGTYDTTPLSHGFEGWRQECLDRAERSIQQGYQEALTAYGSEVPTFRDSGSYWSPEATENWMSFIEVYNARLREVPSIAETGIANGRQYQVETPSALYDGTNYPEGHTFYGVTSAGTVYSNGTVRQVGAFKKSRPGHVGRPALVPCGLYFDDTDKTVKAYYDTAHSTPTIMACQPWMIEQGLYVAQEEFWVSEYV